MVSITTQLVLFRNTILTFKAFFSTFSYNKYFAFIYIEEKVFYSTKSFHRNVKDKILYILDSPALHTILH